MRIADGTFLGNSECEWFKTVCLFKRIRYVNVKSFAGIQSHASSYHIHDLVLLRCLPSFDSNHKPFATNKRTKRSARLGLDRCAL